MTLSEIIEADTQISNQQKEFKRALDISLNVIQSYKDYFTPYTLIYAENLHMEPLKNKIEIQYFKDLI